MRGIEISRVISFDALQKMLRDFTRHLNLNFKGPPRGCTFIC